MVLSTHVNNAQSLGIYVQYAVNETSENILDTYSDNEFESVQLNQFSNFESSSPVHPTPPELNEQQVNNETQQSLEQSSEVEIYPNNEHSYFESASSSPEFHQHVNHEHSYYESALPSSSELNEQHVNNVQQSLEFYGQPAINETHEIFYEDPHIESATQLLQLAPSDFTPSPEPCQYMANEPFSSHLHQQFNEPFPPDFDPQSDLRFRPCPSCTINSSDRYQYSICWIDNTICKLLEQRHKICELYQKQPQLKSQNSNVAHHFYRLHAH